MIIICPKIQKTSKMLGFGDRAEKFKWDRQKVPLCRHCVARKEDTGNSSCLCSHDGAQIVDFAFNNRYNLTNPQREQAKAVLLCLNQRGDVPKPVVMKILGLALQTLDSQSCMCRCRILNSREKKQIEARKACAYCRAHIKLVQIRSCTCIHDEGRCHCEKLSRHRQKANQYEALTATEKYEDFRCSGYQDFGVVDDGDYYDYDEESY